MVVRQIDDLAVKLTLDPFELQSREEGGRRLTESDEIHPECENDPRFHDVDSEGLSLLIDWGEPWNRLKSNDFRGAASNWDGRRGGSTASAD